MAFERGHKTWNKNKTKKDFPQMIGNTTKGRIVWNKDKHPEYIQGRNNYFYNKHLIPWNKDKECLYLIGNQFAKGNPPNRSSFKKGQKAWNKDKKMPQISGKNHPNYKGGITTLHKQIRAHFKYRQWRSDVFTRDDFTCQNCDVRGGGILHAHHIKAFNSILEEFNIETLQQALECEPLWNINNGLTLCKKCHKKIRRK